MEERQPSMCDLADEVLVHVFSFLPSYDLLSVSATCGRFLKICSEKRIVRKLDFSRCYFLNDSGLKLFLQPKLRRHNISEINFNLCYWLPSSAFSVISQLKNLRVLHVLECHVLWSTLRKILMNISELETLSWTWDCNIRDKDLDAAILEPLAEPLSKLKRLSIQLTDVFQLTLLVHLLQYCRGLEELTVSKRSISTLRVNLYLASIQVGNVNWRPARVELPKLRKLYILLDGDLGVDVTRFSTEILSVCSADAAWETVWTSENGCTVLSNLCDQKKMSVKGLVNAESINLSGSKILQFQIIRNDPNPSQIEFINKLLEYKVPPKWRHLSLDSMKVPYELLDRLGRRCPGLEHVSMQDCALQGKPTEVVDALSHFTASCQNITYLNLSRTHIHSLEVNPCVALSNLTALQKLAIPGCYLAKTAQQPQRPSREEGKVTFKHKRVGLTTAVDDKVSSRSRLHPLTEKCSQLTHLAVVGNLIDRVCAEYCGRVTDEDLQSVSRCPQLESLTLTNIVNIRHGRFLESIATGCPRLRCLRLKAVGPTATCSYSAALLRAFRNFTNLKDLRLHQNQLDLTQQFLKGIQCCKQLERLSLISRNDAITVPAVMNMVEKLLYLTMVYLLMSTPTAICKKLQKALTGKFVKSRPAFRAWVKSHQMADECREDMPTFHLEEMLFAQPITALLPY